MRVCLSFTIIVCFLETSLSLTTENRTESVSNFTEASHSSDDVTSEDSLQVSLYNQTSNVATESGNSQQSESVRHVTETSHSSNDVTSEDILEVLLYDDSSNESTKFENSSQPVPKIILNNDVSELIMNPPGPSWNGTYTEIEEQLFSCSDATPNTPSWILYPAGLFSFKLQNVYNQHQRTEILRITFNKTRLFMLPICQFMIYCASETSSNYITIDVLPASSVLCNETMDCQKIFHHNSICRENKCLCPGSQNQLYCAYSRSSINLKEGAVFKAAMIIVACFTAAVVTAFALFFMNRRKICRSLQPHSDVESENSSRTGSDVFSVSDRLARLRLSDTPPTYQEVLRRDRMRRGTPPPAYTCQEEEAALANNSSATGTSRTARTSLSSRSRNNPEHILIARLATELQRRGQSQNNYTDRTSEGADRRDILTSRSYINEAFVSDT